jgi:triphosphoribosyl-dephospho-CoA synthase
VGRRRRISRESVAESEVDLIAAMRMGRDRDRIALQYADDFRDFFESVVPVMRSALSQTVDIGEAILRGQLRLMASGRDTLIERKCGPQVADEAVRRAAACLPTGVSGRADIKEGFTDEWDKAKIADFDAWLRGDDNRRNPGTTADLIAAALYWLVYHR